MKRFALLLVLISLFATGCARQGRLEDYPRPPEFSNFLTMTIGQPVPDFELPDVQGRSWRLSEQAGKTVVLQVCSASSPTFVESLDDFQREVLSRYAAHPEILFVYVFSEEAHPELLTASQIALKAQDLHEYRRRTASQYYYRLIFRENRAHFDITGMIPAATNVVLLIDDADNSVGRMYGYGRGGTVNPAFVIDRTGRLASKALYTGQYLAPTDYQAGNLGLLLQAVLR